MRIFETHKMRLKMRMVWALGMRIFETHFMHMECISAERLQKKIKFKYFIETKFHSFNRSRISKDWYVLGHFEANLMQN